MAREPHSDRTDPLAEQMDRLAVDLRNQGIAPARDLWPGIERGIAAAEQQQLRATRRRKRPGPQLLAAAAVAALLLAGAWWGLPQRGEVDTGADQLVSLDPVVPGISDRAVVEQALAELNQALAADPNNRSLINLAVMVHQSRGRLMLRDTGTPVSGS